MKTSPAQLRAVHAYQNRQRIAAGKDPLDYTPVPDSFCSGCSWLGARCLAAGDCPAHIGIPSPACKSRHRTWRNDTKLLPCSNYREACRRRASDCPYRGREELTCDRCGVPAPHQDIHFIHNGKSGLTETKHSVWGHYYSANRICSGCLHTMRAEKRSGEHLRLFAPLRNLMSGLVVKSKGEKRRKYREHMRKYRAAKLAQDPATYLAACAARNKAWREKRKSTDPDGYRAMKAAQMARYRAKKGLAQCQTPPSPSNSESERLLTTPPLPGPSVPSTSEPESNFTTSKTSASLGA
jgi:hypothetical protein